MNKIDSLTCIALILLLLILTGCTATMLETPHPTETPTIAPTATNTPIPTPTEKPKPTATPDPNDNFDDNSVNTLLWNAETMGVGPKIEERNNHIEIYLPADSTRIPSGVNQIFGAGYFSKFRLAGDFDIEIEYTIIKWPRNNGVSIGLAVLPGGNVERMRWGGPDQGENYLTNYFQSAPGEIFDIAGETRTKDLTGKLRLARNGDEMTGYFFRSGEWIGIRRGKVEVGLVEVNIVVWSGDKNYISTSSNNVVQVELDNFIINTGEVIWR